MIYTRRHTTQGNVQHKGINITNYIRLYISIVLGF